MYFVYIILGNYMDTGNIPDRVTYMNVFSLSLNDSTSTKVTRNLSPRPPEPVS